MAPGYCGDPAPCCGAYPPLAQAGGPTERGDLTRIQVVPPDGAGAGAGSAGGGRTVTFDLQRFLNEGGRVSALPRVRAGATVNIPELPQSPSDTRSTWIRQSADASISVSYTHLTLPTKRIV